MQNAVRIAMLVAVACLTTIAWGQCSQNCPERRTISVSGSDTATADADIARIHVGYRVFGEDAKLAYANGSATSNAIMQALTAAGIQKTAIESSSQVLQRPQPYELQSLSVEERLRRQFMVLQGWFVRAKPDEAAKVLDAAIQAGANESGWIEWLVQDETSLKAEASSRALVNAQKIAEQMAQKMNVHLGHLVSANENQQTQTYGGYGATGSIMAAIGNGPGMNSTLPLAINSRRVEIKSTVFAVFAIE